MTANPAPDGPQQVQSLHLPASEITLAQLLKEAGYATGMVGKSPSLNQLRQTVEKSAPTNSRILIIGPSGAGKELAARHLHSLSSRANGPFVVTVQLLIRRCMSSAVAR